MHLTLEEAYDKKLITYLAEQVFGTPIQTLEKLPGGGCHNYEINHHFIIKLPATDYIWEDWLCQAICAPILKKNLSIQVPQISINTPTLPNSPKEPIFAVSYEKINGEAMPRKKFESLKRPEKVKIFEQLSDAMIELHQVNPDSIPTQIHRCGDQKNSFQKIMKKRNRALWKFILNRLNSDDASDEKDVICHMDLHPENLCIKDNHLTGILDFDLMMRGNAAMEFRPGLYSKSDLILLSEIYQKRSGHSLNRDRIIRLQSFWMGLIVLWRSYNFTNPIKLAQKIQNRYTQWHLKKIWEKTSCSFQKE